MACMSCQKKAAAIAANKNVIAKAESKGLEAEYNVLQTLYDTGEFDFVRYMGPAYTHLVSPRTNSIVKFNLANYGQGRKGDVLLVHNDDIKASPTIFVKLPKNSPIYKKYLRRIDREKNLNEVEEKAEAKTKKAAKIETVKEDIVIKPIVNETTIEVKEVVKEEVQHLNNIVKRSEALTTTAYAEKFGYTHHLQVLALVKSGQLKSYKNEEDDKTYVYSVED